VPAQFKENRSGVRAMMAAPFMVDAMGRRASVGMLRAIQIAPERTGRYKESFHLQAGVHNGVARATYWNDAKALPRLAMRRRTVARFRRGQVRQVRVRATTIDRFAYCVALEIGTKYMPRQRILGRSIDAMKF
jgi:hypothetical protein